MEEEDKTINKMDEEKMNKTVVIRYQHFKKDFSP
jgi:hypothetical protein